MLLASITRGMKHKTILVLFVLENTAAHPLVCLTSLVGRLPLTSHVGGGRVVGPASRRLQRKHSRVVAAPGAEDVKFKKLD